MTYAKTFRHPEGIPEDPANCIAEVFQQNRSLGRQCQHIRRHGDFCRFHMDMLEAGKVLTIPGGTVKLVDGEVRHESD